MIDRREDLTCRSMTEDEPDTSTYCSLFFFSLFPPGGLVGTDVIINHVERPTLLHRQAETAF